MVSNILLSHTHVDIGGEVKRGARERERGERALVKLLMVVNNFYHCPLYFYQNTHNN
jgi:hypothetical protein